jgi:hypothetical protein
MTILFLLLGDSLVVLTLPVKEATIMKIALMHSDYDVLALTSISAQSLTISSAIERGYQMIPQELVL